MPHRLKTTHTITQNKCIIKKYDLFYFRIENTVLKISLIECVNFLCLRQKKNEVPVLGYYVNVIMVHKYGHSVPWYILKH